MDTKETRRKPVKRSPAAAAPKASRQAVPVKKRPAQARPQQPKRPEPEIVYTPPKPFDRNRLLLQLGAVAAVVLAVFFSLWLFFKVSTVAVSNLGSQTVDGVSVSGSGRYSVETVVDASGIRTGDSLLAINKAKVSSQIITKLPYVKSVRIGIKLPGTVNIEIEELEVVYAVAEPDGTWWLMTSEGKLIEKTDAAAASEHTKVLGIELDMPVAGQQAVARELQTGEDAEDGSTQPTQIVTISNAQRLQTALTILQYLEDGAVLGEVASVDVSDMGDIELQYGQRFEILLGDSTELKYKITLALAAVKQLADHDQGTLDVSFIVREEVVYTPQTD